MSTLWAWIRRALGLEIFDRVSALEERVAHNESAVDGAMQAFAQLVKDARR